jgi:hypothetical protein
MTMCGDWRSEERDQWLPSFEANLASSYGPEEPVTWEDVEPLCGPEYRMYRALVPAAPEWTTPPNVSIQ